MNINVKLCGKYPLVKKYLESTELFSSEIDDNTLCILVGKTKELKKEIINKQTICFCEKNISTPHMKCIDLENQVVEALENLTYLSYAAIIKVNSEEVKKTLLNCTEFYFYRNKSDTVLSSIYNLVRTVDFDFENVTDVFFNAELTIDCTINDIQNSIILLNEANKPNYKNLIGKIKSGIEMLDEITKDSLPRSFGYAINRSLNQPIINLILIK